MQQTRKSIKNLAIRLVENYKFNQNICSSIDESVDSINRKTILIIGAGASNAAAGLPLGKELARQLIHKLGCESGEGKNQFDELLKFMELTYGFDKDDFKTILFSLNKINNGTLVKHVQDALQNKFSASFSYRFIASLLSDRYIDAVINFNFDEILDKHIQDKFSNNENYLKVFSDKNCPSELSSFTNKNRFHLPVYVKPHGTISDKDSLRFVRNDFYQIEPLQRHLIENLLSNAPVNLVIIGFRLKFYEFSNIIEKSLMSGSEIFIIDKNEDILDPNIVQFYKGSFLEVTDENTLDEIMTSLFKTIEIHLKQSKSIEELVW